MAGYGKAYPLSHVAMARARSLQKENNLPGTLQVAWQRGWKAGGISQAS